MQSTRKYTQSLDGFQVVREVLITDKCLVEDPSKIEQLSLRRRRESKIVLHVERTDRPYKCPRCGGVHAHAYELRERTVDGVPDAFVPVAIRFTVHRLYCPDCGEAWVERIPFLSKPTSRCTKQLEKTIVALRGEMSIKALSESLGLSWGRVKKVEKDYLGKKYAHIPLKGVKALTIDEICVFHKGPDERKYMTVVRNAETGDVLFVGDGRGADSLKPFEERLKRWRKRIECVCMDMSSSYSKWVKGFLPNAKIVYDHFHVVKAMNDRTDKVRRRTMNKQDEDLKKVIGRVCDEGDAARHLLLRAVRVGRGAAPRRLVRDGKGHESPRTRVHGQVHRGPQGRDPRVLAVRQGVQLRRGGVQHEDTMAAQAGVRLPRQGVSQAENLRSSGHENDTRSMRRFSRNSEEAEIFVALAKLSFAGLEGADVFQIA